MNDDLGGQSDAATPGPIRVLFLCTHNSARSQMAEALLQRAGGPAFEVESAGTEATRVNPFAVRALAEVGIDWSAASSKSLDDFVQRRFDYVVTVCDSARQACPVFPNAEHRLHWGLEDPSDVAGTEERRLEAFRRTRSEVESHLRPFIADALARAGRTGSPSGAESP